MTFEKPLAHAVEYDQIRDAKADTQVLLENEAVKLTLIEWGKNPDNRSVSTIVCVENHSDMTIPAMISGLRINGIYFQSSELVNHLGPGQKCYAQTSILESEIESAGIMSIQEVEVMILTDESQNTGSVSYAGGEWYPIVLFTLFSALITSSACSSKTSKNEKFCIKSMRPISTRLVLRLIISMI